MLGARAAQGLASLVEELEVARGIAGRAVCEAAAARADLAEGKDPSKRLDYLDRCDAELLSSGIGDILGFLLPPLSEILGARACNLSEGLSRSEDLI